MGTIDRRTMLAGLACLGAGAGAAGQSALTQSATTPSAATQTAAASTGEGTLGNARVIEPRPVKTANGAERWNGPSGRVPTGEAVGMHMSVVPPGTPAPALHRINHSELIVVEEGTLEYHHDDVVERAEAGAVLYVPCGTNHFVKNVGAGTARYLVLQVGGDTKTG